MRKLGYNKKCDTKLKSTLFQNIVKISLLKRDYKL